MNRLLCYAAVTGTFAAVLMALACKATVAAEAGPGAGPFAGSKLTLEVDGRTCSVPADPSGQPKKCDCVHLNFYGPNGEDLGGGDVEVGSGHGVDAPPGTDKVTATPCDPPVDTKDTKVQHLGGGNQRMTATGVGKLHVYGFRSFPFNMLDAHGRFVDFSVLAHDDQEAHDRAHEFMRDELARKPAYVQTYGFVDSRLLSDGRVRFSVLTSDKPQAFKLLWNGRVLARSLSDTIVRRSASGWYSISVLVPRGQIAYALPGLPASNEAQYSIDTSMLSTSLTLALGVQQ